jgi:hypothetical protein
VVAEYAVNVDADALALPLPVPLIACKEQVQRPVEQRKDEERDSA